MMTNDEIKKAILASDVDPMWAGRTVSMLEAIEGTGIEYDSQSLLDDMIASRETYPQLGVFLDNLPGLKSGYRADAVKQLGFMTHQVIRSVVTTLAQPKPSH